MNHIRGLVVLLFATILVMPLMAQNESEVINPFSQQGKEVIDRIRNTHNSRTDGGAIITEESLLSPNRKQIVFVVTKDLPGSAYVAFQTSSSEGQLHTHQILHFPSGLRKGHIIPLWSGEFNAFQATPWLRFDVTMLAGETAYYSMTRTPIRIPEQYKEPLIEVVSEVRVAANTYTITAKGVFDSYEPSVVVINSSIFVPIKAVRHPSPGILQFTTDFSELPTGKYLLTICQAGHCDTMTGRHR